MKRTFNRTNARMLLAMSAIWVTTVCSPEHSRALNIKPAIEQLDHELVAFFENPRRALRPVPRGFRIIALSNLAEYCASKAATGSLSRASAAGCLDELVVIAQTPLVSPFGETTFEDSDFDGHGLFLTHLNIVLGAHESVHQDGRHFRLNRRVSHHLARSSGGRWAHAQFYPGRQERWPADQAALLFSLHVYDANYGKTISRKPIERWLRRMQSHDSEMLAGLPVSEITGKTATSDIPRGCALSYTVRYLSGFAPLEAHRLWQAYVDNFETRAFGLSGLREWPKGMDGPTDVDSGPIIFGIGAAATGLGIGASRAVADFDRHARLRRTMSVVYQTAPEPLARVGNSILARSIAMAGENLTRWYEEIGLAVVTE